LIECAEGFGAELYLLLVQELTVVLLGPERFTKGPAQGIVIFGERW
jgi:hypothetical protein